VTVRERPWVVPALAAALSAVLSSGVTAAFLRSRFPDVLATRAPFEYVPERADVAALLVAPPAPYRPAGPGHAVDLGAQGLSADQLAAAGFRRGWTRAWRAGGERVDGYVFEFADERGATAYADAIGRAARLLIEPVPFLVPGVPDATGLADRVRDRNGRYALVVALHRGRWAALIVVAATASAPGPEVTTLAQRQYAALDAP
jgi:hypothetical protein